MNNSNELHLAIDDGFIGSPYSPRVDITETDSGHEISITSKKPEGIVTDTLEIPDADWQRAEDAREAAESSRVRAENSRKAEWDVISADATSATSAANDAADSANQAADAANAAAESATDAESDLRAAAARGDFDGFSPVVDIDDGASSHTITITDREGDHSYTVPTYAAEESARAAAETARVSAESNRMSAESLRVSAEGLRASAESARASAESSRASAESSRRSAENSRVIAETSRANAESSRVSAETARAQAEIVRDEAEGLRDSDEQARVSAETARESTWAELESDAQSAIDAAQDAASDATAAAAEARAASVATWLSGNVLFGELSEGAVLTADDVYSAPPKSVEVYGKSTQAGTPTPDSPVEIKSVDDLTLNVVGKNICIDDSTSGDITTSGFKTFTPIETPASLGATSITISVDAVKPSSQTLALYGWDGTNNNYVGVMSLTSDGRYAVTPTTVPHLQNALNTKVFRVYSQPYTGGSSVVTTVSNCAVYLNSTDTAYEPYVGTTIPIPLSDHIACSLPDGTRDTLTLSYIGPSTEHDGWGVYERVLEMATGEVDLGDLEWSETRGAATTEVAFKWRATIADISTTKEGNGSKLCTNYICKGNTTISANIPNGEIFSQHGSHAILVRDDAYVNASVQDWTEHVTGATFQYILATPVTVTLDPIELPILPNPLTAWADGGSAQPTIALSYEQDINIVIGRLRDAIADMATS